jgi:hypothetical protein
MPIMVTRMGTNAKSPVRGWDSFQFQNLRRSSKLLMSASLKLAAARGLAPLMLGSGGAFREIEGLVLLSPFECDDPVELRYTIATSK